MRSGPRYPPPIIVPAVRADIPILGRIYGAAEIPNLITRLAFGSEEELIDILVDRLEKIWGMPEILIMKALDAESKEITAFGVWGLNGYHMEEMKADTSRSDMVSSTSQSLARPKAGGLILDVLQRSRSPIGEDINARLSKFLDSWLKGTKCIDLQLLMTDPHYQRRGIGTALLDWGHKRADQDLVNSILIASPNGRPLYASVGWREIEAPFELDLKKYAPYAQNGDMGWGTYKFYFMLRLPEISS